MIIGDSGHAKVVADVVRSNKAMVIHAMLDDKYQEVFVENGVIKGPVSHLGALIKDNLGLGVVIGIGSNIVRERIIGYLGMDSGTFVSAVHAKAIISSSAIIGVGTVVMPGAIINADAVIGDHVIVNSGSVVEHDCVVGNFAHVSPLAVLTGGVVVGEGSHIGAGASVIPQKKVGAWTTVGAGAVVVTDIEDKVTAVGAPARIVKKEGV